MVALRTSEQIHWSDDAARKSGAMWGCWDCGAEESYVRDVDKDAEHVRVRRRMCARCGAMWETEERRIAQGSFFGRAEGRRYAHYRKTRYLIRTCAMCHDKYQATRYVQHTTENAAHRAAVERRKQRTRERERAYRRRWTAAKRAMERQNRQEQAA